MDYKFEFGLKWLNTLSYDDLILTFMYDTFWKFVNHVQLGNFNRPYEMEYFL